MDSSIMLLWQMATLLTVLPADALSDSKLAADLAELETQEVSTLNVERDIVQLRRDIKSLEEKEPPGKCYSCCSRCKEKRKSPKVTDPADSYQKCWDECSANDQNSWNGYPCCCRPDFFGDIYPSYGTYFSSHGLADWWTGYACTGMGTYFKTNAQKISDDWQWLRFSLPWNFPWRDPKSEEEERTASAAAATHYVPQTYTQLPIPSPAPFGMMPSPESTLNQVPSQQVVYPKVDMPQQQGMTPEASPPPVVQYPPVGLSNFPEGFPLPMNSPLPNTSGSES